MEKESKPSSIYSFNSSSENVNGKYLRATHINELGGAWIFSGIVSFSLWVVFVGILVNWEYFTVDRMLPTAMTIGGLNGKILPFIILPVSFMSVVFLPSIFLMVARSFRKDGKGWTAADNSFAKKYGNWRLRQKGKFYEMGVFYFSTFERHPMDAAFYEDKLIVEILDEEREVFYQQLYKTFSYKDIFVLRANAKQGIFDIIVDTSELPKDERTAFFNFIKEKKKSFTSAREVLEPWDPWNADYVEEIKKMRDRGEL